MNDEDDENLHKRLDVYFRHLKTFSNAIKFTSVFFLMGLPGIFWALYKLTHESKIETFEVISSMVSLSAIVLLIKIAVGYRKNLLRCEFIASEELGFNVKFKIGIFGKAKMLDNLLRYTHSPKFNQPKPPQNFLKLIGFAFSKKLRIEVYEPSVDEIIEDWFNAFKVCRKRTLNLIFWTRIMLLIAGTIIQGCERFLRKIPIIRNFFKLFGN